MVRFGPTVCSTAVEPRRLGQRAEAERGDRRHAVAAEQQRRVQPDEAVHQRGAQQRSGEPAAAFDEQPGQAALAEPPQRVAQIDLPGRVRRGLDDLDAGVAQRLAPLRVGTGGA